MLQLKTCHDKKKKKKSGSLTTHLEAIYILVSCIQNTLSTKKFLKSNNKKIPTKLLSTLELVLLSLGFAEDKYLGRKKVFKRKQNSL